MKLKIPTLIFAAAFCSATALADSNSCKKISALAAEAMKARQDGSLLEDSVDRIGDGSKFAKDVVMKAYEAPLAPDDASKAKTISEFRNEAYRVCYNAHN